MVAEVLQPEGTSFPRSLATINFPDVLVTECRWHCSGQYIIHVKKFVEIVVHTQNCEIKFAEKFSGWN
jgi:hypothetical protein